MPDPLSSLLLSFYRFEIEQARAYLGLKYLLAVCNPDDDEVKDISAFLVGKHTPAEFWRVELEGSLRKFTFVVAIPRTFPDSFPEIYLSQNDYLTVGLLPHVDRNRLICTRDPEVVLINDKKSGEALEELLKIAVEIVEAGLKKENRGDLVAEFLAYWEEGSGTNVLNLVSPGNDVVFLNIYTLTNELFNSLYIICDSEDVVDRWLTPFQIKKKKGQKALALYLPLTELPSKFFDWKKNAIETLRSLNVPSYARTVEDYFNKTKGRATILVSFPQKEGKVLFGWSFPRWKSIKGFRRNHVPLPVRLTQVDSNLIISINVRRMDKNRILKRGGTVLPTKPVSVAIVGCGSIGSLLSMSLARCGIQKYLLIDPQVLEPMNVARHLCGLLDASKQMKKVEAVKKRLVDHFPHIECDTFDRDVLELIAERGMGLFQNTDLMIVAIGSTAIERRINYVMRKSGVKVPILFVWIEPVGVGGHLLFVHPENGGCFECCFNDRWEFLYAIAAQDQEFLKREAGCQTTYLPYSSVEVEQFTSITCKKILGVVEGRESMSVLYSWVGDLEAFRNLGYRVTDRYSAESSYTVIRKEILPNNECGQCKELRVDS